MTAKAFGKIAEGLNEMIEQVEQFKPGTHGCHEAMHMASVLVEMVDQHLCEHPAIKLRPEWFALADKAQQALFDLYQAIGQLHMQEPTP